MQKRNIIVLGGDGFLGINLCKLIKRNGFEVYSLDKTSDCDLTTPAGQQMLVDIISKQQSADVDIVMMAAQLGSKLFDETPLDPFRQNLKINSMCLDTFAKVVNQLNKHLHISFYSTSEVYGNIQTPTNITNDLSISIDPSYSRSLYAQEKLLMETQLHYFKEIGIIDSLRIFRPFNVSGAYQKRGVVYEMVKSLIKYNAIYYTEGQSREITFIDYATQFAYDKIINRINGTFNITQKNHIYLKDLANCIKNCAMLIDKSLTNISIKPLPKIDSYIKNRGSINVISTNTQLIEFQFILQQSNIVKQLMDEIRKEK